MVCKSYDRYVLSNRAIWRIHLLLQVISFGRVDLQSRGYLGSRDEISFGCVSPTRGYEKPLITEYNLRLPSSPKTPRNHSQHVGKRRKIPWTLKWRDHFKRKNSLPSIIFKGIRSFSGSNLQRCGLPRNSPRGTLHEFCFFFICPAGHGDEAMQVVFCF